MDLVGYSQERFEEIKREYLGFADQLGIHEVHFIPISALNGDMIVSRGDQLGWYRGATLFENLESAPSAQGVSDHPLRFPVQYVCRPRTGEHRDFRGYMGRIRSGEIAVGDTVTVLPAGHKTRVKDIQVMGSSLTRAIAEQSVTLLLEDEIDISRGDMIVKPHEAPRVTREIEAIVCWLGEAPLDLKRKYLLRHTTRETRAEVTGISLRLDINTLERHAAGQLQTNDIAQVGFRLGQALCVDAYAEERGTGAFIVIDESSNNTVGAGMIL
jgi:sulfate adenylyltransferase subunit 1